MAESSILSPIIPASITEYPKTEPIYQGVDDDGNLLFRQFLFEGLQVIERKPLAAPAFIAMGLTEVMSQTGLGKMFYNPLPFVAKEWVEKTSAKDTAARIIWVIKRMPELVYIPYVWSRRDVAAWTDMTHYDRYSLLNARAGGVMGKDNVMPVDLKYDAVPRESFRMNEYVNKEAGPKAMLMIMPKPYIGWYRDIRPLAD
ncbi:MAG: hypothetical protein Q9180_000701 [Flavoplaca navasiana]